MELRFKKKKKSPLVKIIAFFVFVLLLFILGAVPLKKYLSPKSGDARLAENMPEKAEAEKTAMGAVDSKQGPVITPAGNGESVVPAETGGEPATTDAVTALTVAQSRVGLDNKNASLEDLRQEVQQLTEYLERERASALRSENEQNVEIKRLKDRLEALNSRSEEHRLQGENAKTELDAYLTQLTEKDQTILELKKEMETLASAMDELKADVAGTQSANDQLEQTRKQVAQTDVALTKAEQQIVELNRKLEQAGQQIEARNKTASQLTSQLAALDAKLEAASANPVIAEQTRMERNEDPPAFGDSVDTPGEAAPAIEGKATSEDEKRVASKKSAIPTETVKKVEGSENSVAEIEAPSTGDERPIAEEKSSAPKSRHGEDRTETRAITAIWTEKGDDSGTRVIFELNGPHIPKIFPLDGDTPRIVCDFEGVQIKDVNLPIQVEDGVLNQIRMGYHNKPKPKLRSVLDLVGGPNYTVDHVFFEKDNHYVIYIKPEG